MSSIIIQCHPGVTMTSLF